MTNALLERLRGARRIELFAALALAALLALALTGGFHGKDDGGTDLEGRLERVLSRIDGVGSVSAMVAQDGEGRVTGAVIVADGLEDMRAWLAVQRAVEALIGVEPDRIEIIGKDGFGGTA